MQNNEKKAKEAKNYIQVLREVKGAYTKKNDLSLEVNTAIVKAFWISELRELNTLGPWKRSKDFLTSYCFLPSYCFLSYKCHLNKF